MGLAPSFVFRRRLRPGQGQYLARNIRMNPGALVDTDVQNGGIVRYVDIGELAVEARIGG